MFTLVLILNRVIMKKVTLILGVLFGFIFLTVCTDQSTEFEERIELENEQFVDKGGSINLNPLRYGIV